MVLTNSDDPASPPGLLTWRLAALAVGDPFPEFSGGRSGGALAPFLGVYRIGEGSATRRFFARNGKL